MEALGTALVPPRFRDAKLTFPSFWALHLFWPEIRILLCVVRGEAKQHFPQLLASIQEVVSSNSCFTHFQRMGLGKTWQDRAGQHQLGGGCGRAPFGGAAGLCWEVLVLWPRQRISP